MKFFILAIFFLCCNSSLGKDIFFLTYYDTPPFIKNGKEGLVYELAKRMTELSRGMYKFNVMKARRARIEKSLNDGEEVIIPFVNPIWMNDLEKRRYLWSPSIFSGINILVSSKLKTIELAQLEGGGYSLCGIKGHVYRSLDKYIEKKLIVRNDYNDYGHCLMLISRGRVDFTSLPFSIAYDLSRELEIKHKLYFSKKPTFTFKRYLLINNSLYDEYKEIVKIVKALGKDLKWQELLKKYELEREDD